jgi:hypothetical protein
MRGAALIILAWSLAMFGLGVGISILVRPIIVERIGVPVALVEPCGPQLEAPLVEPRQFSF